MRTIEQYNTLNLEAGVDLPVISYTDYEKEIARLSKLDDTPLVKNWFEADRKHFSIDGRTWQDKSSGLRMVSPGVPVFDALLGGKPSITVDGNQHFDEVIADSAKLNVHAWSLAIVSKVTTTSGTRVLFGDAVDGLVTDTVPFYIFNSTNGSGGMLVRYSKYVASSLTTRIQDNATNYYNAMKLMIITFSEAEGLKIRSNGVQRATAPAETQPLSTGRFQLLRTRNANTARFIGQIGEIMTFDVDLSDASYAGHLASLEAAVMAYYGIS